MSREIKFRVWDKQRKQWCPDYFGNSKYTINQTFKDDTVIFQQYTGLKDKNGEEIYEGDIVRVNRFFVRPYVKNGEIDWKSSDGDVEVGVVFYGSDAKFLVEYRSYDDIEDAHNIPNRYEVIGNIFENPELLK